MRKNIFLLLLSVFVFPNCTAEDNPLNPYERVSGEPVDGIRIAWDHSSIQQLHETGGYPRLLRLNDQSIVVVSEDYKGNCFLIRSYDEGKTWSEPVYIFPRFTVENEKGSSVVSMSNPEIIQLQNGDIVVACNYRPLTYEIVPFAIAIRRSHDNGKTFEEPQVIYEAEPRFRDGCWEPAFLELPNGELQVYFANEGNYTKSDEQEITVISSMDNGNSWGNVRMVCFRENRRDGMPVPRIVKDEIVVAIEDNKTGGFKPYTVRTRLSDNWSAPVLNDSPNREYALVADIQEHVAMGAPYLLVLPTGKTMISYYTTENRTDNWEKSTMEVAIGDQTARRFDRRTRPFPISTDKEGIWNSIAMWDNNTVAALTSSDFRTTQVAPYLIKGYILDDLTITGKKINNLPLFVGAETDANLRAGIGADNANLYIKCNVYDTTPIKSPEGSRKGDGVYLYIDSQNASLKEPDKGIFRIWCSSAGDMTVWEGNVGEWEEVSTTGIIATVSNTEEGYRIGFTIPKEAWGGMGNTIRIATALSNYASPYAGNTEFLIHTKENASHTWIKVNIH